MEELKNLVAEKEVELSEKDEKIQELVKQLENAKKLKPSDDCVVPGNLDIGTVPYLPSQFRLQFLQQALSSPLLLQYLQISEVFLPFMATHRHTLFKMMIK